MLGLGQLEPRLQPGGESAYGDQTRSRPYRYRIHGRSRPMKRVSSLLDRIFQQPAVNFFVTNRIPRRLLTRLVGWFSRIENPLVRDASIGVWRLFAGDLNLQESRTDSFRSLHDCFTRELKEGARPIDTDPHVLISP